MASNNSMQRTALRAAAERWSAELRRLIFVLANPEINEPLTPALAIELRRVLAGEAA